VLEANTAGAISPPGPLQGVVNFMGFYAHVRVPDEKGLWLYGCFQWEEVLVGLGCLREIDTDSLRERV